MKHGITNPKAVESFTHTYTPNFIKWVEPTEIVTIATVEHSKLSDGTLFVYRRDTTFSGNLSEAIKVIGF